MTVLPSGTLVDKGPLLIFKASAVLKIEDGAAAPILLGSFS